MHRHALRTALSLTLPLALLLLLSACGDASQEQQSPSSEAASDGEPLTVYSGRSRPLVEGLVEQFEEQADFPVEVRYGTDAQLLAALQEEGERSPADLFWANTTGALAEAQQQNLLGSIPNSLTQNVAAFAPQNGRWTPVTTRFRVLAYNSEAVDSTQLPASVLALPQMDQFSGRIGWTPTYSSFQDFVTALRTIHGRDSARAWLQGMQGLEPNAYSSNTPMIQALADGEIDVALTNHYYVLRLKQGGAEGEYEDEEHEEEEEGEEHEEGSAQPNAPVQTYHFAQGDVGNLALVTGAGVLRQGGHRQQAQQFLRFLLSPQAQRFAAQQVHEYPVIEGASVPGYMLPVDQALALSPEMNFEDLKNLDATLRLMREVGLL